MGIFFSWQVFTIRFRILLLLEVSASLPKSSSTRRSRLHSSFRNGSRLSGLRVGSVFMMVSMLV